MLPVSIQKLTPTALVPERMTEHAAGYDIFADIDTDMILKPHQTCLIPTGIAISLPIGYEAQIRPRSGLALKHQIGVLNAPGTIDADYRGEIKIILHNFGTSDFTITPHMRVAQMVVARHEVLDFELKDNLDSTTRGDGGFGHSSF